jgi:hypothetical protein
MWTCHNGLQAAGVRHYPVVRQVHPSTVFRDPKTILLLFQDLPYESRSSRAEGEYRHGT